MPTWRLTYWISSCGSLDGFHRWANTKTVFSPHTEEVLLFGDEVRYHEWSASAVWIDFCPSFSIYCLLFNDIAFDSVSPIIIWHLPWKSAAAPRDVTDFQIFGWTGCICWWQITILPMFLRCLKRIFSYSRATLKLFLPMTLTLQFAVFCPALFLAVMLYLPVWARLHSGIIITDEFSAVSSCA